MATICIDGPTVHVELSTVDKLLGIHGSFAIPLSNVTGASAAKPPAFFSSLKLIGTDLPWAKIAGSFLYHGEIVFFDYRGNEDAVLVIDVSGSRYRHIFVHVDDPDSPAAAAERIAARARLP